MSLLEPYESDPMKRIFSLHFQKHDIMFLLQKNILATTIKLPQKFVIERKGKKINKTFHPLLGTNRIRNSFLFISSMISGETVKIALPTSQTHFFVPVLVIYKFRRPRCHHICDPDAVY